MFSNLLTRMHRAVYGIMWKIW